MSGHSSTEESSTTTSADQLVMLCFMQRSQLTLLVAKGTLLSHIKFAIHPIAQIFFCEAPLKLIIPQLV